MLAKIISLCQSKERRHHREQKNQWNFSFEDKTKGKRERNFEDDDEDDHQEDVEGQRRKEVCVQ